MTGNAKFSSPSAGPDEPFGLQDALGKVVPALKEEFGLKYVYCWHALAGFWGGKATITTLCIDMSG